ncbi:MAG: hypothetical protein AAGH15_17680 [Myxococcota bacterium]
MTTDGYPTRTLDNGEVRVTLALPDAERGYYRGSRFDWSGVILQVEHRGHTFCQPLHERHDPLGHDAITGPAGELGLTEPLGYTEARPGESFLKIGVGRLEKRANEPYAFDGAYRLIEPGTWSIEHSPTAIAFEQRLEGERGWAYRYRKTVELLPGEPAFRIAHELENTGSRLIDTDVYNHNFTCIDGDPVGPNANIELPFPVEGITEDDRAHLEGHTLRVKRELEAGESMWFPLFEGERPARFHEATIRNERTGASMTFRGDAPVSKMVFWAVRRAVCVEPFESVLARPESGTASAMRFTFAADSSPAVR